MFGVFTKCLPFDQKRNIKGNSENCPFFFFFFFFFFLLYLFLQVYKPQQHPLSIKSLYLEAKKKNTKVLSNQKNFLKHNNCGTVPGRDNHTEWYSYLQRSSSISVFWRKHQKNYFSTWLFVDDFFLFLKHLYTLCTMTSGRMCSIHMPILKSNLSGIASEGFPVSIIPLYILKLCVQLWIWLDIPEFDNNSQCLEPLEIRIEFHQECSNPFDLNLTSTLSL